MSRRSLRIALIIFAATLVSLGIAAGILVKVALDYPDRQNPGDGSEVALVIEKGMSFPAVAARLVSAGIIDRPRWFRFYAMRRGVTTEVKPGTYALRDDITPKALLDTLIAGVSAPTTSVTVPEGLNMLEVFAIFERAGVASAAELERLARDPAFLKGRGIRGDTVEGYLFPDTYELVLPTPPERVLGILIDQHRAVWKRIAEANADALAELKDELGWTDHDILTMATIVEKEAVVAVERARIAQVFINRLVSPKFKPHRLDTDPTIRYGCTVPLQKSAACKAWDPTGRLRTAQLRDKDNPYNTYQHEGLPPGPICNPGAAAIEATIRPDGSEFFFFVSRNDGTHVFSKNRRDHDRAVDKFQR